VPTCVDDANATGRLLQLLEDSSVTNPQIIDRDQLRDALDELFARLEGTSTARRERSVITRAQELLTAESVEVFDAISTKLLVQQIMFLRVYFSRLEASPSKTELTGA
jgi:hypothetical protein